MEKDNFRQNFVKILKSVNDTTTWPARRINNFLIAENWNENQKKCIMIYLYARKKYKGTNLLWFLCQCVQRIKIQDEPFALIVPENFLFPVFSKEYQSSITKSGDLIISIEEFFQEIFSICCEMVDIGFIETTKTMELSKLAFEIIEKMNSQKNDQYQIKLSHEYFLIHKQMEEEMGKENIIESQRLYVQQTTDNEILKQRILNIIRSQKRKKNRVNMKRMNKIKRKWRERNYKKTTYT